MRSKDHKTKKVTNTEKEEHRELNRNTYAGQTQIKFSDPKIETNLLIMVKNSKYHVLC